MTAYVSGQLPHAFALVVAAHVSMCDTCRVLQGAHIAVGGVLIDDIPGTPVTAGLRDQVFAALETPAPTVPAASAFDCYPAPVSAALGGAAPAWKSIGLGVRQAEIHRSDSGLARLFLIPAGQRVPDHSHQGLELTLVLQGGYRDSQGHIGVGDIEIADGTLAHMPHTDTGQDCICLAATDGPLQFQGLLPRLMQTLGRI